jgi:hypothetical protein
MTVDLHGSPGAFSIARRSRATQLVKQSSMWGSTLDHQMFGRWVWQVVPRRSGSHELMVNVSADLCDSAGVPTSEPYADRTFPVRVRVNLARASVRLSKMLTAAGVTGLVGAYTHEVWWPQVKSLLVVARLLD